MIIVSSTDIHSLEELLGLADNGKIVGYNLVIREGVDTISGVYFIDGSLGITSRTTISLGSVEEITGDLWVSIGEEVSQLESLGKLRIVGGDINLKACSKINSLGTLEEVGGTLNVRNTLVRTLGRLKKVGGNLYLPIEMKDMEPVDHVSVDGKVKFWKYQDSYNQEKPVNIFEVRQKELNEGRDQMTGMLATKLGHISQFTAFGRNNIDDLYPFIETEIQWFKREHGVSTYLDAFFDEGISYKKDLLGFFNSEYYRQFFESDSSYEYYHDLDDIKKYPYHKGRTSFVFLQSIIEQLTRFFRPAEDRFRESRGIPKIGEGWTSETDLFYKICDAFKEYEVVQHGRPTWLGRQHLDIYFPKENVAIEYQGLQHFKPVEYFGGEEGFKNTRERDQRKLQKCKENRCALIFVDESLSFESLVSKVKEALSTKNQ